MVARGINIGLFTCIYFCDEKNLNILDCNLKKISDYKNISRYLKNLFEKKAINTTTNFEHIKRHYYFSHEHINPNRIIPVGPELSL